MNMTKKLMTLPMALMLMVIATTFDAAAGYGTFTYNGIQYDFYFYDSGANAVADYAEVAKQSHSLSGSVDIPSTVTYEYTYVSGYDNQGNATYATLNMTAPVTGICPYAPMRSTDAETTRSV